MFPLHLYVSGGFKGSNECSDRYVHIHKMKAMYKCPHIHKYLQYMHSMILYNIQLSFINAYMFKLANTWLTFLITCTVTTTYGITRISYYEVISPLTIERYLSPCHRSGVMVSTQLFSRVAQTLLKMPLDVFLDK